MSFAYYITKKLLLAIQKKATYLVNVWASATRIHLSTILMTAMFNITITNWATSMLLAVDEGHPRDWVLIVIWVFVATFDKLLFSFFKSKRSYQTLTIAWDIDISHVPRVVYPWLTLQVMASMGIIERLLLVNWVLLMTFVDWVLIALTLKVWLTGNRLKRVFVRWDYIGAICDQSSFRSISL